MTAEQIDSVSEAICEASFRCDGAYSGRSQLWDCVFNKSYYTREDMEAAAASGGALDERCLSRKLVAFNGAEECEWDDCFGIRCSLFVGAATTGEACEEDWHCESELECHGDSCRQRCRF